MESHRTDENKVEPELANTHAWFSLFNILLNEKPIISNNDNNEDVKSKKSRVRRVQKNTPRAL